MNRKPLPKILLLILLLIYWAVSLRHLAAVPPVYEDEPWIASTAWKVAAEGVFGSDLFAGYYNMETHYYGFMPVHPFLMAAVFKLAGLGLFQARFEAVIMGLLILALTYALGRHLFRPSVGLLAVFLLLFTRTSGLTPSQLSGIVLVDFARIARYDIVVPVFGLTGLLRYTNNQHHQLRITNYALIGFLTALATLSHLYGLFWFAVFFLLFIWHRAGWQKIIAFVIGFLLPWALYAGYVLPGWPDWVGQTQDYAPRFELLNLNWYWHNFVNEFQRYGPGLGTGSWFRPGFWTAAIVVPLALIDLGRLALQGQKKAQILLLPVVVIPVMFALLIYLKLSNYLITLAPLFALIMAWGLLNLSKHLVHFPIPGSQRFRKGMDLLFVGLFILIAVEGTSRFVRLDQAAAVTTQYAEFSTEISRHLPPDGRILALHNYWFGFAGWDYRSWYVPLVQINPGYWQPPLTIEAALSGVDPAIIFIDPRMRDYFEGQPETAAAVQAWMAARGFEQTAVVDDKSYGRLEIYLRPDENE